MKASLKKNAVYKVILNACNLLIPLFVGPYITRLLDADLYGAYNRVYAEFTIFVTFAAFGIYNYGIREISKLRDNPDKLSRVYSSLFVIGIFSNLIVGGIYVAYFLVRPHGVDTWIYAVMLIQLAGNIFYNEFVNEAEENYGFIALKTIIIRLLYFAAIFIFVRKKEDIIIYAVVVSMTVLLNNLVSFFYIHRKIKFNFRHLQLGIHLIPLLVTLIYSNSEMLYTQLDKVMLGPYVNDIAVTEYTIPVTLVGMVGSLPLAIVVVAMPRLSKLLGDNNRLEYQKTIQDISASYMSMMLPMAFGIAVLSKEIMWLYTGDKYTYAYPVLIVAALTRIPHAYFVISANLAMYINGMEKALMVFSIAGGLLNLGMNYTLVAMHVFTPLTAALTTFVANVAEALLAVWYSKIKMQVNFGFFNRRIWGYVIVSLLFVPISLGIRLLRLGNMANIVMIVVLCAGLYGVYMIVSKDPMLVSLLGRFQRKKSE